MVTDCRTALVTGAAGFVGSALVEAARREGYRVRAIVHGREADGRWGSDTNVEVVRANLEDARVWPRLLDGVTVVFHAAGRAHRRDGVDAPRLHMGSHVGMMRGLVGALRTEAPQARVVFISTLSVYGPATSTSPRDESVAPAPTIAYGVAKLEAEQVLRAYAVESGAHAVVLRPAMIYGVGCKGNLPRMIRGIRRGWFPIVDAPGRARSLVHVDDVVAAALCAAECDAAAGEVLNVTDGEAYDNRRLVAAVVAVLGRAAPMPTIPGRLVERFGRVGDAVRNILPWWPIDSVFADTVLGAGTFSGARAARVLNVRPQWTLERALPMILATLDHKLAP